MKYYQLGHSGLIVSELALAMTFGSGDYYGFKYTVGQQEANEMIAKAIDKGVNFFDTAVSYAKGESEIILGKRWGTKERTTSSRQKWHFVISINPSVPASI